VITVVELRCSSPTCAAHAIGSIVDLAASGWKREMQDGDDRPCWYCPRCLK
jgi:hypothetical protein